MKRFHKIFSKFALLAVFIQLLSVGLLYAPKAYADEIEESDIIINEISPSSSPEWVEIFNKGANLVDISGWIIRDATSGKFAEISTKVLSPGEYYTIEKNGSATLNNDDDTVELYNNDITPTLISQEIYNTSGLTATQTYAFHEENTLLGWGISEFPTPNAFNDFNGIPSIITSASYEIQGDKSVKISIEYNEPDDFAYYEIKELTAQITIETNTKVLTSSPLLDRANYLFEITVYDFAGNQSAVHELAVAMPSDENWRSYADNIKISVQNSDGGLIELKEYTGTDLSPTIPAGIIAFGKYWSIEDKSNGDLFKNEDSRVLIRVWFKTAELPTEIEKISQIAGLYYYKLNDQNEMIWLPFSEMSVHENTEQDDISQKLEGYDGYIQVVTDHFTEFTAVADIAGPEIKPLTDNSQKDRPFLTYTYNVDDKAGSGISKVELIVDGEIKATNNYSDIPQAKTDTISYRVSQNKTYTVTLKAYDAVGNITESNLLQTEIDVPIPSAPTNLKIERIDGKYLLSWDDGRGAWVDYYSIYFSTDAVNYSLLDKTNLMSYTIDNLLEGKIYYFKVLANSIGGDSQSSSVAYIAIAGPPVAPVAEILTTPVAQAAPSPAVTDTEEEDIVPPPANPVEEEAKTDEEKDNTRIIITIIVILLAAGAGIGGYYGYLWWQERIAPENTQVNETKKPQAKKSSNPKTTKKPTKRSSSRW